ncbi:hypothetical protein D3C77_362700 [compost metagenome]
MAEQPPLREERAVNLVEKFAFPGKEIQPVELLEGGLLGDPERESDEQGGGLGTQAQGGSLLGRKTLSRVLGEGRALCTKMVEQRLSGREQAFVRQAFGMCRFRQVMQGIYAERAR